MGTKAACTSARMGMLWLTMILQTCARTHNSYTVVRTAPSTPHPGLDLGLHAVTWPVWLRAMLAECDSIRASTISILCLRLSTASTIAYDQVEGLPPRAFGEAATCWDTTAV